MTTMRKETDSLGIVEVAADKLWGAQTQRSLEHFSIGKDLIPREMITAYATLKKAAAIANRDGKRLDDERYKLIVQACDEILAGQHHDMFPLHVWMTGSGTQFNMNVNEVISNRCCQLAGTPLGSHAPVHPNDHVNMAQSSNDSFPSAMCIAAAVNVKERLVPAVSTLRDAIAAKSREWDDIIKIGRTHMQDATPLTLGQEWSGYAGMLSDNLERIEAALSGVYRLALGGTAVGTGINSAPGFAEAAAAQIARLTGQPFVTAPNKFTVQGAHDALVQLSGTLRTLAVSLYKIANDIRLMSCGPRAGFAELQIPDPDRGHQAQPEEDQRICRTFADAGDGAFAGDRLRQGVEDRALRDGQRSHVESGGLETWLCRRGRIRSGRRSQEDGKAIRGRRAIDITRRLNSGNNRTAAGSKRFGPAPPGAQVFKRTYRGKLP